MMLTLIITEMFNNSIEAILERVITHHFLQFYAHARRLFPANWRTKLFGKRPVARFARNRFRWCIGVMAMDPWHFVAALYAYTGAASTGLVGVPARGTDANRHGSPMAGRVPLD